MSKRAKRNAAGQYYCKECWEYSDSPLVQTISDGHTITCCTTCEAKHIAWEAEEAAYEAWLNEGLGEPVDLEALAAQDAAWDAEQEAEDAAILARCASYAAACCD